MAASATPSNRVLLAYYAATVLFLMLDFRFGINVRAAAFEAYPGYRTLYYVALFGCLAAILWRPAWSTAIGVVESLIVLVALIVNMALRTMIFTDAMLDRGADVVTLAEVLNFAIAGSVAYFAWQHGMTELFGKSRQRPSF